MEKKIDELNRQYDRNERIQSQKEESVRREDEQRDVFMVRYFASLLDLPEEKQCELLWGNTAYQSLARLCTTNANDQAPNAVTLDGWQHSNQPTI